jgi:hypothetical protein
MREDFGPEPGAFNTVTLTIDRWTPLSRSPADRVADHAARRSAADFEVKPIEDYRPATSSGAIEALTPASCVDPPTGASNAATVAGLRVALLASHAPHPAA